LSQKLVPELVKWGREDSYANHHQLNNNSILISWTWSSHLQCYVKCILCVFLCFHVSTT